VTERIESPFRAQPRPPAPLAFRAMTGYEEEVVESRMVAPNTAALCNEFVARCASAPGGDFEPALARVRGLPVARRDEALIQIRRLSLGDVVHMTVDCDACGKPSDVDFRLSELPIQIADATPRITLDIDDATRAVVRLPTAGDQEELFAANLAGESERRSWLLGRLVESLGEQVGPLGVEAARALPVHVRNTIEARLEEVIPDLDLGMAVTCAECGHEFRSAFDVASFFLSS
jgi:hypothetical protein